MKIKILILLQLTSIFLAPPLYAGNNNDVILTVLLNPKNASLDDTLQSRLKDIYNEYYKLARHEPIDDNIKNYLFLLFVVNNTSSADYTQHGKEVLYEMFLGESTRYLTVLKELPFLIDTACTFLIDNPAGKEIDEQISKTIELYLQSNSAMSNRIYYKELEKCSNELIREWE